MKERAEVVVVGGGCVGLSTAYNLAKRGLTDVVVLEKSYLGSGATGRCAGGIRAQFSTEPSITLARESLRLYEGLSGELGMNILFHQGGYLFLALTEAEAKRLRESVALQNSLGVRSRMVDPEEAQEIAPLLNTDRVVAGAFHSRDGVALHYPVVWGYASEARRLGVEIETFTSVGRVVVEGGEVKGVATDKGSIRCRMVVNAAGADSVELARGVGVELPIKPYRREMLVTEPLKPLLNPLVISREGLWGVFQTLRGEVGAVSTDPAEPPSQEVRSTLGFLERVAGVVRDFFPRLGKVKVMRQWAGLYDVTPDATPILGGVEGVEGFFQANGFSGHGFMLAPVVGKLTAELIVEGRSSIPLDPYTLDRFKRAETTPEKAVV